MEVNDDITEFILSKIQSLCAQADEEGIEGKIFMIEKTIEVCFFSRRFRIGKI